MKNIESIILHFENCESIEIEGRYIGEIEVRGLKQVISRHGNGIRDYRICDDFVLEIHKDADKRYKSFGMISDDVLFNRLMNTRDIVSITIKYNDGSIDNDIYVPYHEEENTFSMNKYQYIYYSIPHHLYIVCSKENKISDYFDIHYINDTKAIDIHWKMIQR